MTLTEALRTLEDGTRLWRGERNYEVCVAWKFVTTMDESYGWPTIQSTSAVLSNAELTADDWEVIEEVE